MGGVTKDSEVREREVQRRPSVVCGELDLGMTGYVVPDDIDDVGNIVKSSELGSSVLWRTDGEKPARVARSVECMSASTRLHAANDVVKVCATRRAGNVLQAVSLVAARASREEGEEGGTAQSAQRTM